MALIPWTGAVSLLRVVLERAFPMLPGETLSLRRAFDLQVVSALALDRDNARRLLREWEASYVLLRVETCAGREGYT